MEILGENRAFRADIITSARTRTRLTGQTKPARLMPQAGENVTGRIRLTNRAGEIQDKEPLKNNWLLYTAYKQPPVQKKENWSTAHDWCSLLYKGRMNCDWETASNTRPMGCCTRLTYSLLYRMKTTLIVCTWEWHISSTKIQWISVE